VAVNGTLTLSSGALTVGSNTMTLSNAIAGTVNNPITAAGSSIAIAGSGAGITLPSTTTALTNLSVNNANGGALAANLALSGTLTLTAGILSTGSATLSLASAATATRTSGYVSGNLKRTFVAPGAFTFLVGTANGYSPMAATVTAGTGDLTVKATQGAQPNVNSATALQRFWTLAGTGVTANLVFSYVDPTDIAGTEANYRIVKVSGGTPSFFANACPSTSCVDTAANTATVSGVSSFSDWTLAETADLTTSKSGPAGAIAGAASGFSYTATVTNNGPANNTGGVTVTDVLPAGTTFTAAGSDAACSAVGQTVTCATASALSNGNIRSFVIHVTVPGGVAAGTVLANTATVVSNGTNDPTPANNGSNTVNTTVFVGCNGCPFIDPSLTAMVTPMKAAHVLELRNRVDVQRIRFGLDPYAWSQPLTAGVTVIRAQHVLELRAALGEAYVAHGTAAPTYTDPVLAAAPIRAVHINELRMAVTTLEAS